MSIPTPPKGKILAFDPGYERLGVAVVAKEKNTDVVVYSSCIQTPASDPFPKRLGAIGTEIRRLIAEHKPAVCALETLYFSKNQKTAMRVAEVRGMILFIAQEAGLSVFEYTPLQIKAAVAGFGHGDKAQIARMIPQLVKIGHPIEYDDEYDAIAVGLTCLASERI